MKRIEDADEQKEFDKAVHPNDYLYHFLYVDEFNTPEDKIDWLIEGIVKEEAEWGEWPEYEWVKHKIVSEFTETKTTYYVIEVREKK